MRAGKPGAGLPTGFAVPVLETGSTGPCKTGAPAAEAIQSFMSWRFFIRLMIDWELS